MPKRFRYQEQDCPLWTMFAYDVGFRRYVSYLRTNPEARQLLEETGWWKVVSLSLQVLPRMVAV